MTENTEDRAAQNGRVTAYPERTTAVLPTPAPEPAEAAPAPETSPGEVDTPPDAEVLEGEIVEESSEEGAPRRVDAEVDAWLSQRGDWLADLAERAKTRRPIVPEWARSKQEAAQTARWVAQYYAHVAAYQATRSPKYLLRLVARAPRGASRFLGGFARWVADWEGEGARIAAAQRNDPEDYIKLSRQRDRRVRARGVLAVLIGIAALLVAVVVLSAPSWVAWVSLAALGAVLGWLGAPADRPLIDRAVLPTKVEPLTSDVVLRALGALGISEITKALSAKGDGIRFPAPIVRDGPGWRAETDLPHGVTANDVIERRYPLASGLRRPLGCVWPEGNNDIHPGRLVLWVGDEPMNKARQPAWPLLDTGAVSVFEPLPYGVDQRGRPVSVTLMFANLLIGAIPRMGKTFALRVLLLACALDPLCELRVFELKGTGDLKMLKQVSHDYAQGFKRAPLERALNTLREIRREMERRADKLDSLPADLCPENKVTPDIAAKRSLGLHPLVIAIDECHFLFDHPEFGAEAGEIAEEIIKVGPAMGIMLILATQRPDKNSIPTGVSANAGLRLCFKVTGQLENDMILGTSSYKNGLRATTFAMADQGIAYAVGWADEPLITRSSLVDRPKAERVAARALEIRRKAGRLTGVATGDEPETPEAAHDLLDDIAAVRNATENKAWSSEIVDRLAELRPEVYGAWAEQDDAAKARQLSAALKPYGVKPGPVGRTVAGDKTTRYGIDFDTITEKITERDKRQG